MTKDINEKYIEQVLGQSYKFYKKAQEYDSKNETEGALINYLLALNNLNNFKEYMNSLIPNNFDQIINEIFNNMDSNDDKIVTKTEFNKFLASESKSKHSAEKIAFLNGVLTEANYENGFTELAKVSVGNQTFFNKDDLIKKIKDTFNEITKQIDEGIKKSCGPDDGDEQIVNRQKGYCNLKLDEVMKKILNRVVILQSRLRQIKANYLNRKTNKDDDKKEDCKIKPTVISGNKLLFEDVIGQEEAKKQLINGILNPILYPRLYPYLSKGILFWGPPGTGKTLLAKALVNELQKRSRESGEDIKILFYAPTGGELKGKYVGETEKNISKYFKCASEQAKDCEKESTCYNANNIDKNKGEYKRARVISVLFIDEIEAIAGSRADDSSGIMTNSVNTLLQMMDGVASYDNVIVIGATNYPWKLDSAINRRFGTKVFLNIPGENYSEIVQLIKLHIVQYIRKSLKLDMDTDDLNNGDTLLKFSQLIEKEKAEKDTIIEDSEKGNCKENTISCYNDLICLPVTDDNEITDLKSIADLYNLYKNKFFPEFTKSNLIAYSKILGERNYTQGDVKNIMRSIFRIMGERAINQATEKLTVFIDGDNELDLKNNLKLYNHQAIDYFKPSNEFQSSNNKKKFTFNYYEPCGSELPINNETQLKGNDLLLFTTDAYNTLLKNIKLRHYKSIAEIVESNRQNFISGKGQDRYSGLVTNLLENQFKYIAHSTKPTKCPEEPDDYECGITVTTESHEGQKLDIDFLNESLHLYVKENLIGNIFRKKYVPFIARKYFGLKLAKKSKVPNRTIEIVKNYREESRGVYYLYDQGKGDNKRISIVNNEGGSISWSDQDNEGIQYILIKKNKFSRRLTLGEVEIKYFIEEGERIIPNNIIEINNNPKLRVLKSNDGEQSEVDIADKTTKKYIILKLQNSLKFNHISQADSVILRFYDDEKNDTLKIAKCKINDAYENLGDDKKLWGGEFNKFLPYANYNDRNKIGYLVLYWLGYDLKNLTNTSSKEIALDDDDVKKFIDEKIEQLKTDRLSRIECTDLRIPMRIVNQPDYDIVFTNLVVLARRNFLNYIFKSLKIVFNNVITVTSFIQQPSIIAKYILLNDVITQLISLDLNHILKKRLEINNNYKAKIFMDNITKIRGIFHQTNTLMLPMELNEKYNINYDGEVYLRYSISSEVNDYNPITYDTRDNAVIINTKEASMWKNYNLAFRGTLYRTNPLWRAWYATKFIGNYVLSLPQRVAPSFFTSVTNINKSEAEQKLEEEGRDNYSGVGTAAGLGAAAGLGVLFFTGPLGWGAAAIYAIGGAAVTGGAVAYYNRSENQKVLKLLDEENISKAIDNLNDEETKSDKAEKDLLKYIENNPNLAMLYEMKDKQLKEENYLYEAFYNCVDGIICVDNQSKISSIKECVEKVGDAHIEKIQGYINSIYPSKNLETHHGFYVTIKDHFYEHSHYSKDNDLFRCNEFTIPIIKCMETNCNSDEMKLFILLKRALSNGILLQSLFLNYNSPLIKKGLIDYAIHFRKYINRTGNKITDFVNETDEDEAEDEIDLDDDEQVEEEARPPIKDIAPSIEIELMNDQLNLYGSSNALQAYYFIYDRYNLGLSNTNKPSDSDIQKGFYISSHFAPPSEINTYDLLTFILNDNSGNTESNRKDTEIGIISKSKYPGNKNNRLESDNGYIYNIPHRPYIFCNTCKNYDDSLELVVHKGGAQCENLINRISENEDILTESFKMNENKRFINLKFNPEDFQYAINTMKNLAAVRPSTSKEHIDIMRKYQQNSDNVTEEELKKIK